jgi:hypothetical protein
MASILPPMVLPPSLMILISPSRHYSASVVAADDTLYALWSKGAKIQGLHNDSQELKEMVNESLNFPCGSRTRRVHSHTPSLDINTFSKRLKKKAISSSLNNSEN